MFYPPTPTPFPDPDTPFELAIPDEYSAWGIAPEAIQVWNMASEHNVPQLFQIVVILGIVIVTVMLLLTMAAEQTDMNHTN